MTTQSRYIPSKTWHGYVKSILNAEKRFIAYLENDANSMKLEVTFKIEELTTEDRDLLEVDALVCWKEDGRVSLTKMPELTPPVVSQVGDFNKWLNE